MSTERSEYRCVVKEFESAQPFLVFEPFSGEPPTALRGHLISIDLKPGTTLEEAKELASALNQKMIGLAVTA